MSSVWFIVPGVGKKIITSKQWQFYGITAEDSIWGPENGWSVPESSFSAMQLNILDGDSGFLLGQEDGPRTYPPPPGDMLNDEVSGFAYYIATKKLLEQLGGSTWNNLDLSGNTELINGSTLSFYNTTDQVTNYERLRLFMNSSVYQLTSENGGSGTKRAIAIAGPVSTLTFGTSTATLNRSGSTTSTSTQFSSAATFTASTGQQSLWGFIPTINQSSTAGYTALLVNPTETATGNGNKNLADFQVGGVSRTRIDNQGTHVLSSLASLINYNTSDETTNYERVREYWIANSFNIFSEAGGSGVGRDIKIIAGGSALHVQAASGLIARRDNTAFVGTGILAVASTGLTGSGGIQQGLSITPNMNQSGTAGYTMLLVNPTESATGSGAKLLADFQVGGVSKFSVNNAGVEFHANVASAPATPTGGGVIYVEAGALKYKGSSGTVTVLGAA